MTPRYTFFHKIVDCYHSATLSCFVLSMRGHHILQIFNEQCSKHIDRMYLVHITCLGLHGLSHKLSFTSLRRVTILVFETEPINIFLKNFVKKCDDFLNSCNDCITASIYCQTIFKYSSWIRTNVSLAIPTIQLSLCGPLRPKPLDDKTLRNSLTNF
jgi:hypothetical protein